jgi:hypothetical protein
MSEVSTYYPELKWSDETKKKEIESCQITAEICRSKYIVYTDLTISGRGIEFRETDTTYKGGKNRYSVTQNAMDRLSKKYQIALALYLD